jgi:hypothetical protein
MPESDSAAVERIITNTIKETARGDRGSRRFATRRAMPRFRRRVRRIPGRWCRRHWHPRVAATAAPACLRSCAVAETMSAWSLGRAPVVGLQRAILTGSPPVRATRRLGNSSVEPYPANAFGESRPTLRRTGTMPMLDHPKKTAQLMTELKAAVPFKVELTPWLIKQLHAQHDKIANATEHVVSDLSYAGDEGGIVCHIATSAAREMLVVSLTHVLVPRSMAFAAAVAQYQKHRVKKLKKQGNV